ncbi:hypothetical protein [Nonomuraea antri]|uniref:hypothetical protein n=1 Tax=Nonomuraea antri TaxID=2730852 RepID=UPI001F221697|nr:hypothetical protein [Nonomuraea antri]
MNARQNLLVVYTGRLAECRAFYTGLGLDLRPEQHGAGPRHYAAVLADGTVFELYPARPGRETGALRLGFTLPGPANERRLLEDPDGRTVELHVVVQEPEAEGDAGATSPEAPPPAG